MDQQKQKILIVDDEKGLRLGTKRLLEKEGFEVVAAENGTEGIAFGTSIEFDAAIIDMKMPDFDGIMVLKEIIKKYPNTACFIATAYASYDTAIESARVGAFSYIPKPFSPEELLLQINKGLEKRELNIQKEQWRKEREERLLEVAYEKTRLNTIINSISDGVLVINKNGEAVLYNPSALKFLVLKSITIEEYIIDKLPEKLAEQVNNFLKSSEYLKRSLTVQIHMKDNDLVVEATSSPVPAPDGSLAGVAIVIKNITELKKLEFLKSQFVSMVSHELKAPVAAVYGFLKLISDKSMNLSPEKQDEFIDRSIIRLDSLLKMVNDLLDISRMEMKTTQREIIELNLPDIINNILELFQLEINKKNIKIILNAALSTPSLSGDQDEITRLFTNLISNGIKYNKQDGSLNIKIEKIDDYLVTEIKDSGIGMKSVERNKLFHEFYRVKNEFTKDISGTGLGLSIVKRIIDSYAGKIEVDSEFGKGTSFRIFLPVIKNSQKNNKETLTNMQLA
ncbi:MAG: response regulator [Ignavibacteriaceae bacterium]|nr:response regulator [Ignavibacteriaceae bacterium]